ncbi:putative ABC transport system permease protein [Hamadaea flava]|uniref:FtsX-like permease family protein n=1 Tax=Hamadaea flava TaxID=1742688 RepID=A0ABV8LLX6_9ACTN|nr:FtsX-like permease family protein [Hamadaea flava]MCP2324195.1 putative ABC transport system permease protein [Hamadaea flava]
MSAVWRAARAAIQRRRLQTFVIGLVVLMSTLTIVIALVLLDASSAPFDRTFTAQQGPHAVAVFDPTKVTDAELTSRRTGVASAAGPFRQALLDFREGDGPGPHGLFTVVGRGDPGGPVDRLDLWRGRWPTGPGEVVLNLPPMSGDDPQELPDEITLGGVKFLVVGHAYSLSQTADAWVTPEQMTALKPTGVQMLYRFTGDVSTKAEVEAAVAAVTSGLTADALIAAQPYQVVKDKIAADIAVYVPLLATFGVLGLVVAVVIVGNVVSGAVVSGFRHIGVLKAIGFTPRQVVAVYLVMVSVPAVAGGVLGTVAGAFAAQPLLSDGFEGLGLGGGIGAAGWVWAVALLGVPTLVAVTALVPALRAHRLSAAEAISAGSAPRTGRGLRVQRRLAGTRLPRAVSLGLGLPFARPGRTAFTVVAVLLGVTTVTFATGLADTLTRVAAIEDRSSGQIAVQPSDGSIRISGEGRLSPQDAPQVTGRTDAQVEALLRGLPNAARVAAILGMPVPALGQTQPLRVNFVRGDYASMGYQDELTKGRWATRLDETVVSSELMRERGLTVGDRFTLELDGRRTELTIVGETMDGAIGPPAALVDWRVLTELAPDRVVRPWEVYYQVQLVRGGSVAAYVEAVRAADPGIDAWDTSQQNGLEVVVISFSAVLALLLSTVAALGVFNTVVLNVHERRRSLGMLKSIGMTPRQVVAVVLTSMGLLGAVGGLLGLPLGIVAHRVILPITADAARVAIPRAVLNMWHAPTLALLVVAGVLIALVGALVPARRAARLRIAEVLHNE